MEEVNWLIELASDAGERALAGVGRLRWQLKADRTLVTNLDAELEELIRRRLRERFPNDAIWGEETGGERRLSGRTWIIDPIDGTHNLVHGIPVWGVSIGLAVDALPRLGVFRLPVTGETYHFQRGGGAFWNGAPLAVDADQPLTRDDTVVVASEVVHVADLRAMPGRIRNLGSAAAHLALVARGAFRASASRLDRLHDLGCVYGLALEAGCRAEWLSGGDAELSHWFQQLSNEETLLVGPRRAVADLRAALRRRGDSPSRA